MGNGDLFFGITMNWVQICILIHKYVETNPKILEKKEVQRHLLRYHIRRNRESVPIVDSNGPAIQAEQDDLKKAEIIMTTTTTNELHDQLLTILETYFKEENDPMGEKDNLDCIYLVMECIAILLETRVTTNGACCRIDDQTPYVIGYEGGGICRGDTSAPVSLPPQETKEKLIALFDLINEVPDLLIVMNDCDSCT